MSWNPEHCPTSKHPDFLHGVLARDRTEDNKWVYGACCYCQTRVRADLWSESHWSEVLYMIEEDPI
jgi:hypothetical protein